MEGHSCLWSKVVLIAHVWTGGCPLHLPKRKLRKWPFPLDEAGGAWWLPSPEVAVTVHKLANANLVAFSLETCHSSIWIISQQKRTGRKKKKGLQICNPPPEFSSTIFKIIKPTDQCPPWTELLSVGALRSPSLSLVCHWPPEYDRTPGGMFMGFMWDKLMWFVML